MTVEELQVLITANTNSLRKEIQESKSQLQGLQNVVNKTSGNMFSAFLKSNIAVKLLSKTFQVLTANIGDAVTRLDTLNNFPRVMSNLGVSNEDAQASMQRLSDALTGLPTTLDDATMSVQRFTSANGNVKASTEMFIALNNAILSGGADMQVQKTALEQLSQAYAKGKPDMMEWRSAMATMPAQLKQVSIAMGYASADQLGEALRSGTVSMNEFMAKLIELNKYGANGFASFEEQAKNSTGGVNTSITNLKTALTRGLAEIMNAIGQSNIAGFFNGIASAINKVIPYITGFVKACVWAVSMVSSLFGKSTKKTVENTTKAMTGLGSSGVSTASGFDKATGSAKKLKKELNGLASFDEMNILKEANDSSSGGGGGGATGGAGGGLGDMDLSAFDSNLTNISSKAEEVAERIKSVFQEVGQVITSIWNSEPVQAFTGAVTSYAQFIFDFWSSIGTNLVTNIKTTWSNISGNVNTILTNMSKLWTTFWTDIDNGIKKWGQPIIDGVTGIFNSIWTDAIDPVIQLVTKQWADFSQILLDTWNKYGKPLIDNIGQFATNTIALFQKIWDKIINPIIKPFLEMMTNLWNKHLKGLVESVANFIMKLVNGALEIYNKFIYPLISWVIDKLSPIWGKLCNTVITAMGNILGNIVDKFRHIIDAFSGVIDFLKNVFSGDWASAWESLKSTFSNIVDALPDIFKIPINFLIDQINKFINGLNKLTIPDWVPRSRRQRFSHEHYT
jgi:tape measure domain-containing protein